MPLTHTDSSQSKKRHFQIAGITVRLESDLNFDTLRFKPEFTPFAVEGPGDDNVTLRHHFELPDLRNEDFGQELYRKAPWVISHKNETWYYRGVTPDSADTALHCFAMFDADHTHGTIYNLRRVERQVRRHGWHSLSLFPTDQIWLTPLLADRNAVLLHSGAAQVAGQGLVFVGHSSAGKSTMVTLLKDAGIGAEILCDDRNVVRRWDGEGWRVHGTWSHGTVSAVSAASAPLRAVLFLNQAERNEIVPLTDRKQIWRRLLATLIRAAVTAEWWQKELDVLERLVADAAFYDVFFDRSGAIVAELAKLAGA
jgi:hypothetical protein